MAATPRGAKCRDRAGGHRVDHGAPGQCSSETTAHPSSERGRLGPERCTLTERFVYAMARQPGTM